MRGDDNRMIWKNNRLVCVFKRSSAIILVIGVLSLMFAFWLTNSTMAAELQDQVYDSDSFSMNESSVTQSVYEKDTNLQQSSFGMLLGDDPAPKTEFRGAWIATVSNIDWPSNRYSNEESQKQELINMLDELQQIGINAVVFQVKPSADALYQSDILPWSEWLTGTQGQDPGYDPLQFAIDEAHKRNMEFHAWFNPFRANTRADMTGLTEDHPVRGMVDGWVVPYGNGLYFNPGIEGVRNYVTETIIEVVEKYDIDGVHIDDYFYPYPVGSEEFDDDATYLEYGGGFTDKGDWRRSNVNRFVEQLSMQIKDKKPFVQFGISPFGIWRNASTDPTGSLTSGLQSYDAVYADSRTWIQNEWVDYIAPQIYWSTEFAAADYDVLVEWWANEVKETDVQLYIGQAAYKIANNSDPQWLQPDELINQIRYNRMFDEVKGGIFYSSKPFLANPLGILDRLSETVFEYPAMIPAKEGSVVQIPEIPAQVRAEITAEGILLTWEDNSNVNEYYVVYRLDEQGMLDLLDPSSITAFVRKTDGETVQSYLDKDVDPALIQGYVVTAVNRHHYESEPSVPALLSEVPDIIPGDANNDGVISIGDLTMMISLQDMDSSDPDWALVAHLDLDGNEKLELNDIRLVAQLILGHPTD